MFVYNLSWFSRAPLKSFNIILAALNLAVTMKFKAQRRSGKTTSHEPM